jgi:DNA mismatch repair protein MutL
MGHTIEALTRLALAHSRIHFTLTHNGRLVHDLPPVDDIRQRVAAFFGEDLADNLLPVESTHDGVTIEGYVANPMQSRATARMQYLFLNGRAIRDRALQHALGEAYRGLLLTGRQPICFLRLAMPAELIDVNVHPTKQEVRFADSGRLYSQLLGTLRTKFLTTDLTARGKSPAGALAAGMCSRQQGDVAASELVAWAKQQLGLKVREQGRPEAEVEAPGLLPTNRATSSDGPFQQHRLDVPLFRPFDRDRREPAAASMIGRAVDVGHATDNGSVGLPSHVTRGRFQVDDAASPTHALQVHNRYLVVETDAGLEVIDQHALHERILYEQLREKVLSGTLESQRLLVPEPVDLTASEAAAALGHAELLARLGIDVQPFGGETVLVSSYPAMLAQSSPAEVLRELVEKLLAGGNAPEARDLLDELLHMFACKAAVKFGDRLSAEEIDSLLAQRHLAQDSHHCPHGRPTALVFTREDLDRQFKRI